MPHPRDTNADSFPIHVTTSVDYPGILAKKLLRGPKTSKRSLKKNKNSEKGNIIRQSPKSVISKIKVGDRTKIQREHAGGKHDTLKKPGEKRPPLSVVPLVELQWDEKFLLLDYLARVFACSCCKNEVDISTCTCPEDVLDVLVESAKGSKETETMVSRIIQLEKFPELVLLSPLLGPAHPTEYQPPTAILDIAQLALNFFPNSTADAMWELPPAIVPHFEMPIYGAATTYGPGNEFPELESQWDQTKFSLDSQGPGDFYDSRYTIG